MERAILPRECGGSAVVFQLHPRIGEQRAFRDEIAVPPGDGGPWLGDDEGGALLRQLFGNGSNGMAEAEAHEKNLRLAGRAEGRTGEAGQLFFCGAGGGATNLLTMDEQEFPPIMLLERQDIAIRERSFGESDAWFHETGMVRCEAGLSG